jgi:hypothetical protein
MKKNLISLLFVLLSWRALPQSWAPLGATWTYEVRYAWSNDISYNRWTAVGDTVIAGKSCRIIECTGPFVSGDFSSRIISCADSGKVYLLLAGSLSLLYDFEAEAGESWDIANDSCHITVHIDTVTTDTLNGFPLSRQKISTTDYSFDGDVIAFIGNTSQPLPGFDFSCNHVIHDDIHYAGLRCYQDSITGLVDFQISPYCDYIFSSIGEPANAGALVYPNPASDYLTFANTGNTVFQRYVMYSGQGRALASGVLTEGANTIMLTDFHPGFYILKCFSRAGVHTSPLLILR